MNLFEQTQWSEKEWVLKEWNIDTQGRPIANLSRRALLKRTAIGMGGLVIGMQFPAASALPMKWADTAPASSVFHPNAYLKIAPNNSVTVVVHRSEMGQGIRTSIPMLIADELEVDWKDIIVEQALADKKYGSQNTDGSRSIRRFYSVLREAAASARMLLEQAAAARWQVPVSECRAQQTSIVHSATKRSISFGDLVSDAAKLSLPEKAEIRFKSPKQFRFINQKTHVGLVDGKDIATGHTTFGIDAQLPDMKVAVIERPPVLASQLKSFDATEAKKVKGVIDVVALDNMEEPPLYKPLGGVAVIATNTWSAMEGRKKLKIEWALSAHKDHSSEKQKKALKDSMALATNVLRERGNAAEALKEAKYTHQADYYVPALIHAPMEPPAALAEFKDGKFRIWACTQAPQAAQDTVAQITGVKPENIQLYVTLIGGGFGRKSKADFVAEAAVLAKKLGYPVKVTWTREDEIQQGYYHAESYQQLTAGWNEQGKVTAWQHLVAEPPIGSTFQKGADQIGGEANLGLIDLPWEVENIRCASAPANAHHRIGWLRSVTNINHAFASCSFVDELAHQAKQDPKSFWLNLIGSNRKVDLSKDNANYGNYGEDIQQHPIDTQRLKAVIEKVSDMSDWDAAKKQGRFLGLAAHRSFVAYVAVVVEVSKNAQGKVTLENVWVASDSGTIVNHDRVRSQMEGAVVFGISLAKFGAITSKDGKVEQSNYHDYQIARLKDVPPTHIEVMINDHPPGGVGEPGVPPVAPAITNAIFAATGQRFRELPLYNQGIFAS